MNIGRVLLLAFLSLVLLPLMVVTSLGYFNSRQALRDEIHLGLERDAETLMQTIDSQLFERLENLRGWKRLDVMQEAQVKDVDKRLAQFLTLQKISYGDIYNELSFINSSGEILASSQANNIGTSYQLASTPWMKITLGEATILVDHLSNASTPNHPELLMRTEVRSRFSNDTLGYLLARINWNEIIETLNHATSDQNNRSSRIAFLVDKQANLIAYSTGESTAQIGNLLANNLPGGQHGVVQKRINHPTADVFISGFANSRGVQHFSGLGWRAVISEPEAVALAPVAHLAAVFTVALLLTGFGAIVIAFRLSQYIATPITELAEFSRNYDDNDPQPPPVPQGFSEVRALNRDFSELTERLKKSRTQLVQASKLATVGELAATMAHEVRTPLGILSSSAQILALDDGLSSDGQEMINFILSETERLNRLVTMLLECGRPRAPVLQTIDFNQAVQDSIELLRIKAEEKNISIQNTTRVKPAQMWADLEQLKQVLLNLLLNAIQITPANGQIKITVACENGHFVCHVEDSGPGVQPMERMRVFEPFITAREGGFGLGLSVVLQILRQHQARISVSDSKLGGADFKITFAVDTKKA